MLSRKFIGAALFVLTTALCACSGGGQQTIPPPAPSIPGIGVFDGSVHGCNVSYDGLVFYAVPAGDFSPLDVRQVDCGATLARNPNPPLPQWAHPSAPTKTIFVATSLQEAYSLEGMQSIESAAAPNHVPVTWMVGNSQYVLDAPQYSAFHTANGDDVQAEDDPSLIAALQNALPWYRPTVSAEGGGHERNIAQLTRLGETAFWGITWDTRGIDGDWDLGAPWGAYCADPNSYKRPAPDGSCALVGFEWTARDLTRAYLSGHSEYFSTDPDDLLERAGFSPQGAASYIQAITDAYAAAGQTQPLVMMSQQESAENLNPGDSTIMSALYARAVADGMHAETLSQAAQDARSFAAAPRAVAFPFIPGGINLASDVLNGGTLYPSTIDYHDTTAGMTFIAGHTTPVRVFEYAQYPQSAYNVPLPQLSLSQTPSLQNVAVTGGTITFHFTAPSAVHYGVALWSDPAVLAISGRGVTPAGRAGVVLTFDLQSGPNDVTFACAGCKSTTLPYAN